MYYNIIQWFSKLVSYPYKKFHTWEVLGCELNIKFFMPILSQINNNAFIKLWIEEENHIQLSELLHMKEKDNNPREKVLNATDMKQLSIKICHTWSFPN